ncbi:MAG: YkgJ family cysteine cluster protein [Phycisphaerales bacterium]|nr:MAG: YkgJ family cysteine cluster protein [Phycisphaerales bacterium]
MGSVCCEHCTAACCHYIALPIDRPESRRDFDDIRWYLMHKGITVFVEDDDWYVQIPAKCGGLLPDNRCRVYETRPKICREYKAGDCDYAGGSYGYDELFQCEEDILAYVKQRQANKNGNKTKKPRKARRAHHGRRGAS